MQTRLIAVQVEHVMLTARIRAGEDELRQALAADAAQGKNATLKEDAPLTKEEIKLRDEMVHRELAFGREARNLNVQKNAKLRSLQKTQKLGKQDHFIIEAEKEFAAREQSLAEMIREDVEANLRAKRNDGGFSTASMRQEELERLRKEERGYRLAEENLRIAYSEKLKTFLGLPATQRGAIEPDLHERRVGPEAKRAGQDYAAADRNANGAKSPRERNLPR